MNSTPGTETVSVTTVDELNQCAYDMRHSDSRSALKMCGEALEMAIRLKYTKGMAYALLRMGVCEHILAESANLYMGHLQQALDLFRGLGDVQGEADVLNVQAIAHAAQNEFAKAIILHERVLAVRRELGDRTGEAATLNNLALVYRDMGQLVEALDHLQLSLDLAERSGNPLSQAFALVNIGGVLLEMEELRGAEQYLQRGLNLVGETNDRALECVTLVELGNVYAQQNEAGRAMNHLNRGLAQARKVGNHANILYALIGLGKAQQIFGHHAESDKLLLEALALARRSRDRASEATVLCALAHNRLLQRQAQDALPLLNQALDRALVLGVDPLAAQVHRLLADTYEQLRDFELAHQNFRTLYACEARMRSQEAHRHLQQILARAEVLKEVDEERRRNEELSTALEAAQESANQAEGLLAMLSQQADALKKLAREDGLTGLANRRWLDIQIARERERARRYGRALSVAMIDIDYFKRINDTLSHSVGDEVLRVIGRLLQESCRASDLAARYGGEEFTLVLVETNIDAAALVCEKLMKRVHDFDWAKEVHPDLEPVTISVGLAAAKLDDLAEDLCAVADRQLYRAKREGRNRICR